jgi:hypothetical protein
MCFARSDTPYTARHSAFFVHHFGTQWRDTNPGHHPTFQEIFNVLQKNNHVILDGIDERAVEIFREVLLVHYPPSKATRYIF